MNQSSQAHSWPMSYKGSNANLLRIQWSFHIQRRSVPETHKNQFRDGRFPRVAPGFCQISRPLGVATGRNVVTCQWVERKRLSRVNEWNENGWGGEGTLGGESPSINGKVLGEASKLMVGKIEIVSWCFIECLEPSANGIITSLPATIQLYFASFLDKFNKWFECMINHRVHKWMRQNAGTMDFSEKQPVLTPCLWSSTIEEIWRIPRWC